MLNGPPTHSPLSLTAGLALWVLACSGVQEIPPAYEQSPDTIAVDATVQVMNVEGGCWALTVSEQARFQPVNLPEQFRVDGLRVRVTFTHSDAMSVCMIGPTVTVLTIERL